MPSQIAHGFALRTSHIKHPPRLFFKVMPRNKMPDGSRTEGEYAGKARMAYKLSTSLLFFMNFVMYLFITFPLCDFSPLMSSITSLVPASSGCFRSGTLRSRGRSSIYRMVRPPLYSKEFESCSRKIADLKTVVKEMLDDTNDVYGLYEELQSLTNAMERYDRSVMDEVQGDYMKSVYETILNVCDEVEEQVSKAGRSFSVSYCKSETKKLVRAYHAQARWTHEHILPTFNEYLENGMKSTSGILNLAQLMMGMEEADKDAFQWLTNFDARILRAINALGRLYNDIQSHEDEVKRKGQLSGLACYMKEYNVSKKEAIEA